ncbi:MAG: excinuclease ABC subunit UvrC [Epulopiscium sp.]|nr:excinuclease ABC subunit UvrC [Candidatus Epulonipiscium sp.]
MFDIKEELKKLPHRPGVYLMKNDLDQIIYVGKAKVLKNRVSQYFQKSQGHSAKVRRMVENISSFEYIVTDSELEALILESNLIKKHSPKYNIRLKDDKNYPYIKVDIQDDFPKVRVVREIKKDKAKYFGPYTDVGAMWELIEIIKKTWHLRTCRRVLPRDIGKKRPCLNYHIGQCKAPCAGKISKEEYRKEVDEVLSFLSGKYSKIIRILEEEMKLASHDLNFEKAAILRDQIRSIKHIEHKQSVLSSSMEDQDIIAYARSENDSLIQVYFVRTGKLVGREHFLLEETADTEIKQLIYDFLLQFYADAAFIPKEILLQSDIEDKKIMEEWLTMKKSLKVELKVPLKGSKHNLLELAKNNAEITLAQFGEQLKKEEIRTKGALREIKEIIGLEKDIIRIEAYDISNTQGVQSVGSMVVFENGRPKRSDYRKFKIKSVIGPDDYASMKEVLERRLIRLNEDKEASFSKMPDLILIDGGKGQVSTAKEVIDDLGLSIPICGMVKDDRHRTRGLLYKNKELPISPGTEGFNLITRIQDEAHRFAIDYHRKLMGRDQVRSVMDDIPGVGKKRKEILINHFASVANLRKASLEEIKATPQIPEKVAQNIYDFFNKH